MSDEMRRISATGKVLSRTPVRVIANTVVPVGPDINLEKGETLEIELDGQVVERVTYEELKAGSRRELSPDEVEDVKALMEEHGP